MTVVPVIHSFTDQLANSEPKLYLPQNMSNGQDNLTCPFCDFVDKDSYFLLQHVELIHPENGESPFVVKDASIADQGLGRVSPKHDEEAEWSNGQTLLSAKSSEGNYLDCPYGCGESILSGELQVHQDLHVAEGMALEEYSHPAGLELSSGPCNDQQALADMSNAFSTDLPKSLRNYDQLQPSTPSSGNKRRRAIFRDLFLPSPTSLKRRSPMDVSRAKTQRLSVRLPILPRPAD